MSSKFVSVSDQQRAGSHIKIDERYNQPDCQFADRLKGTAQVPSGNICAFFPNPTTPSQTAIMEGDPMLMEPTAIPEQIQSEVTRTSLNAGSNKPVIIRLDQLSKDYIEAGKRHNVLNALDRQFYQGDFVCLLGKSGSGKSTLLNLISGIDAPTGGEVFIRSSERADAPEVAIAAMSDHQRTLFRRRNIGIVFQFFNLIPTLTVLENVTLPIELAGAKGNANTHALDLLDRVGLADRVGTYPDKLSGGEQQRVAIARALAHDPVLILADEPTGNLDEDTGNSVLSLLLELTRDAGKTLFMATHAPDVARRADRVLHLEHGKLVSDRTQPAANGMSANGK